MFCLAARGLKVLVGILGPFGVGQWGEDTHRMVPN
jgi:hypothetical protein